MECEEMGVVGVRLSGGAGRGPTTLPFLFLAQEGGSGLGSQSLTLTSCDPHSLLHKGQHSNIRYQVPGLSGV